MSGVLHCGTVAIRDAQVAIATVGGPASEAVDSVVQTGLDGSFSYAVPAGPDRSLQFSYTAYSDDLVLVSADRDGDYRDPPEDQAADRPASYQ